MLTSTYFWVGLAFTDALKKGLSQGCALLFLKTVFQKNNGKSCRDRLIG